MYNDWDSQRIANWNRYRFPCNRLLKQLKKVEEEISEFKGACKRDDRLEELADIYIACAGFGRFSPLGEFVCQVMEALPDVFELKQAVNAKMAKNNQRTFDEDMHHIPERKEEPHEDSIKEVPGKSKPEYITVRKVFGYWKQDEKGNWHRTEEPFEFKELKKNAEYLL